jgi:circadian clock protein KaiC
MLGGGVPEGDSILIAGPSGTGKSVIASQFIAAGTKAGEPGIIAVFEERPQAFTGRAANLGLDLDTPQNEGLLKVLYLRPLDLSVDETLQELLDAVKAVGAKRIVIDSLAGFEMALAPAFRQDFRESLYRMIGALTGTGATVLSTVELTESFTDLIFSPYAISFLTDDIIRLRYVEIDGALRKILAVVKMRGGHHSKELREYTITDAGLEIGPCPQGLRGLVTGVPMRVDAPSSK